MLANHPLTPEGWDPNAMMRPAITIFGTLGGGLLLYVASTKLLGIVTAGGPLIKGTIIKGTIQRSS